MPSSRVAFSARSYPGPIPPDGRDVILCIPSLFVYFTIIADNITFSQGDLEKIPMMSSGKDHFSPTVGKWHRSSPRDLQGFTRQLQQVLSRWAIVTPSSNLRLTSRSAGFLFAHRVKYPNTYIKPFYLIQFPLITHESALHWTGLETSMAKYQIMVCITLPAPVSMCLPFESLVCSPLS